MVEKSTSKCSRPCRRKFEAPIRQVLLNVLGNAARRGRARAAVAR